LDAPPNTATAVQQLQRVGSHAWLSFREYVRGGSPLPPRRAALDRVVYGLAQPILGGRIIVRDVELLKAALYPPLLLGVFCAAAALLDGGIDPGFFRRFYRVFAVLAPLPSIVFARHYARLAATAHRKLGFGDCEPRLEGIGRAVRRAVYQAILIAIAAAPVVALLRLTPLLGRYLAQVAAALWALHWVVIDAFDDARILEVGESLEDVDAKNRSSPTPWFIRCINWLGDRLPPGIRGLTRSFARFSDKLSLEWREEMALAEAHPSLVAGFGVMTAALLATPALNLFFRPIIIVASVHLLGQVSRENGCLSRTDSRTPGRSDLHPGR